MSVTVPNMHDSPNVRAAKRHARRAYFTAKQRGADFTRAMEAAEDAYADTLAILEDRSWTRLNFNLAPATR